MKVLGISDEITVCEKCGKQNLKRTVALDTGYSQVHYGTTCASKAIRKSGINIKKSELDSETQMIHYAKMWKSNGHTAKVIADGIWNKFGFLTEIKGEVVFVKTITGLVKI
jgi:hypothetical protein